MRKQMIENAAYEVATQVRSVEDMIDGTLGEIAELQSKMLRVCSVSGTGAATSQPAFEQLAEAVQALISARGGMARCHAELAEARKQIPGLRTVSFGDSTECPPKTGVADLRIVA